MSPFTGDLFGDAELIMTEFEDTISRETLLWTVITNMGEGVAFIDKDDRVVEINETFCNFMGFSRKDVLNKHLSALKLDEGDHQISAFIELYRKRPNSAPVTVTQRLGEKDLTIRVQPMLRHARYTGALLVISDVSTLVEAKRVVEKEKNFLEKVINVAGAAVFLVDREGRISTINNEFTAITGYTREDILGQHSSVLRMECTPKFYNETQDSSLLMKEECLLVTRSGRVKTILRNAAVLTDEEGAPIGGIESFVDVSELTKARTAAVESSRLKGLFLATMSHEIRTPLNAIMGFLQILERSNLDEEQKNTVEIIGNATEDLLRILQDLLDISRIEANRLPITPYRVDLQALLDDMVQIMGFGAGKKGVELVADIDPNLGQYFYFDGLRLRQILFNLLSNAIKFTEEGRITLSVKALQNTDEFSYVCFSVSDTGVGIAPDQCHRIFEEFAQAKGSPLVAAGTGLGLSIANRLVKLLGGEPIELASTLGQGSVFSFTLPLPISGEKDIGKESKECIVKAPAPLQDSSGLEGLRVLLVEDDSLNRIMFKKMLESIGADLNLGMATNGQQALELCAREMQRGRAFDVIFIDSNLGDGHGLDVFKELRKMGIFSPVIAMTGEDSPESRQACLEAGMMDYLAKPYRLEDLSAALDNILRLKQEDQIIPKINAYLETVLGFDCNNINDVLNSAAESMGLNLFKLAEALEKGDKESIQMLAHTLKGTLLNLGLPAESEYALYLENVSNHGNTEELRKNFEELAKTINAIMTKMI